MILLFEEDETKFDSLGLGVLRDATECSVAEGLNDQYTLELKYPVKGQNFDKIKENRLIYCKPNPFDEPQPFRIASISRPINGIVTVDANHISYDMNGIPVNVFKGANFLDTINSIKKNCVIENKFEFINNRSIDKKFYKTFQLTAPTNLKALLTSTGETGTDSDDSTTGSIGSVYDIEFKYDKWNVIFCSRRGSDKGVEVRYSKNMTDLTQETTTENLYSAVYPFYHKTTTSTTTNTTDAGFTKVYIVGNKPFQDGWLSYSEGGEPYHPVDESGVQIATEGQYKDKIYCWNSKASRYEEKVYNQSVTLIEGMGSEPEWIKIDWSKFPVVSCNAVKDGYFKKMTDTSGWTFHKAGDVVFDGKVTDLSNISSNRILYYSEVIPASESSTTTEMSKVVHVELDEKLIKLTTDDAKAMKHQYVLPLDLSSEFETEPTKEKLKQKAEQYIKKHKLGKIKKSTDVSFIDLWNITESENLKVLKSVEIGDTVSVVYPELGVDEKLRVISTEYNAILDSYTKIELGEKKDTLSDSSVSTGDNVSSLTNDTGYTDENKVSQIVAKTINADYIQAINAKLSKAQIEQLQTERIKCTGILEASQFEIDKLVAKMLVADNASISQTLSAGQIKVSGDIDIKSGQINITGDDGTVFKVDREGHVTANGLNITGGSIEIQNGDNDTSFSVNSDGYLVANGAKIYGEVIANSGSIGGCEIVDGELQVPAANITGTIQVGSMDKDGITTIVNDTIKTTNVTADNLRVKSANIDGSITIGQLDKTVTDNLDEATANANSAAGNASAAANNANSAADRVKNAEADYSNAKDAYADAKTDNETAASKLKDAETNYSTAKEAYTSAKSDNEAAASKLSDAESSYSNAKKDSETAAGNLADAKNSLDGATTAYTNAKADSDAAAKKLSDAQNMYQSTLDSAKSEYDKSVADAKKEYDNAAKDSQAKIDAAEENYKTKIAEAESSYNEKVSDATSKYNQALKDNTEASNNLKSAKEELDSATNNLEEATESNNTAAANLESAKKNLSDAQTEFNSAKESNTEAANNLSDAKLKYDQAVKDYNDATNNLATKLTEGQAGAANLVEQRLKNAKLGNNTDISGFIIDKNGIRSFTKRDTDGNAIDSYNSLTTNEKNGVYLSEKGLRMGEMPSISEEDYDASNYFANDIGSSYLPRNTYVTVEFPSGKSLKAGQKFKVMFDSDKITTLHIRDGAADGKDLYLVSVESDSTELAYTKKDISSDVFSIPDSWNGIMVLYYEYSGNKDIIKNVRIFKQYPSGLIAQSDGTIIATEMHIGGAEIKNGILSVPSTNLTGKITADVIESNEGHIANFNIQNGKLVNGSFVKLPSESEMAALKKTRDDAKAVMMSARNDVNLTDSTLEEVEAYAEQEKASSSDGKTLTDDTQRALDNAQSALETANKNYTSAYNAYKKADYNVKNAGTPIDPADTTVDSKAAKSTSSSPKPALYIGTDGIHLNQRISNDSETITESNFKVTADGKIQADNCEIDGKITATEGQVGGLYISDNSIYYPKTFSDFDKDTSYKTIQKAILGKRVVGKNGKIITYDTRLKEGDLKVVDDEGLYIGTDGIRIGRNAKNYIENYIEKGITYPYSFGGTNIQIKGKEGSIPINSWEKSHGGFMLDKYGNMYMANASINGTFSGNLYPNLARDPFRYISRVITSEVPDNKRGYMYIGTLMKTNESDNAGAIHITGIVGPWVGEKQVIDIVISTRGGLSVSGFVHGGKNVPFNFDIVATDGYSNAEKDILGNDGEKGAPCYAIFLSFTNYYFINLNINSIGSKKRISDATRWDEILDYHYDGRIILGNDSTGFTDTNEILLPYIDGKDIVGDIEKIETKSILEKHLHCPGANPESDPISGNYNILFADENTNLVCSSLHTTESSDRITFKTGGNSEKVFSIKGHDNDSYDLHDINSAIEFRTPSAFVFARNAYFSETDKKEVTSNVYFFSRVMNEDQWWCIGEIENARYIFASQSYDSSGTATGGGGLGGSSKLQSLNVNINYDGTIWVGNDGHQSKVWIMVVC